MSPIRRSRTVAEIFPLSLFVAAIASVLFAPGEALAAISCARTLNANVVALDQPISYNRLGASNINGMVYALERDVINKATRVPLSVNPAGAVAGQVELRPDRRPRQLVLRVAAGDCLQVKLTNLLNPPSATNPTGANPNNIPFPGPQQITVFIDDQVADRTVGFHVNGMQLVNSIADDSSMVGNNAGSMVAQGQSRTYKLFAEKEGVFLAYSEGATIGGDANQGHTGSLLWGQVIVEPKGARIYRSQVTDEELRLASMGTTPTGQPMINYEATYPTTGVWATEGKAGLPVLNMLKCASPAACEIVHSEINAIIAGPNSDGTFPPSTYPLESVGKRNPTLPNRLEPFRDFASGYHDEPGAAQAFPGFYVTDPVFRYVLAGVKDGFMINYGSGGIGSEIIANRLGVGPMHDCLSCAYEEFFLTAYTVGDPAMLVDIPANTGLEALLPGQAPAAGATGPKATYALYPEDSANVHHSYTGDFVKFRNTHVGKENHVFHLHNHQWIYNPNDDNGNYLDAQGIGPGVGYTYEINFGGSGNRNKTAGDAIFHCHFYPHFAQGMWYMWRIHDTFEAGTRLAASGAGFHTVPFALQNGTPAAGARALPDGEIVAGVPIPAVVPLPGKAMAVMPGAVEVVPNPLTTIASTANPIAGGAQGVAVPVGSLAKVIDRTKNPGYPFWIAGIEETVGQRPPTPPLDMLDAAKATALKNSGDPLWANINPAEAGGFDGGLRRHAMHGVAAGGVAISTVSAIDFSKVMESAKPQYYPEEGTDVEKVAMAFHAQRLHPSSKVDMLGNVSAANYIANGNLPAVGAPYQEPCIDDNGDRMNGNILGQFFSGESLTGMNTRGRSAFTADNPRIYKGTNIQFDAILTKTGYHNPQQRIVALWDDAVPIITKEKPPEPLVMRLNTFDCAVYWHSNLVPEYYEMDDYQVRTPTDIIGQHIHLPKWDLTTADGSANGWNYEDGTLSPGTVRERIHAVRHFNHCVANDPRDNTDACPLEKAHPFWGQFGREDWVGARTTLQRWFADPVVNTAGVDRGLGIIFTHDHYGPSTHQQIGLYSTVLVEPAGSTWVHNETGVQLGAGPNGTGGRHDGGPTSWQAMILPPTAAVGGNTVASETVGAHREFYFEFSDFQHAYEAGVYVGAGPDGRPLPGLTPRDRFTGVATIDDAFRYAINPPARQQINPVYPDLVVEVAGGIIPGCLQRPCPQAIDVQDPGMFVVNYRAEPIGLRVFNPTKAGPDGKPGMQADGLAGDLAYALASSVTDSKGVNTPLTRAIADLNKSETQLGFWTTPLNSPAAVAPTDPFTPMLRAYAGDTIRVKIQAGGHEEEHNASIHGLKWLQGGSGFGRSPNSGWRASQAAGISEQFTLAMPEVPLPKASKTNGFKDYLYNVDSSMDGWWSGSWGLIRAYATAQADLPLLPNNPSPKPSNIVNAAQFNGVCPLTAPVVNETVVAVLANDVLSNPGVGVTIVPNGVATQHVGGPLTGTGSLVYNPRTTQIPVVNLPGDAGEGGGALVIGGHAGPLHDPTAMLYVRLSDLVPVNPAAGACRDGRNLPGVLNPGCAVKLKDGMKPEPLVLRAAAGSCVNVTLYNRLPELAPDLPTLTTLLGAVKRDRNGLEGSIPFDNNLIRASSHVGLAPQLLAHDISRHAGVNIGQNETQTVGPIVGGKLSKVQTYTWYVGDIRSNPVANGVELVATPVEFGGFALMPADKVKQGQKSLMGGFVALPQGATWTEDAGQHAQATVTANGKTFRDMMVVMAKNLNHRYGDGAAVEHMNGEGVGIPEDSQESSAMAFNYGIEPLWFRFGLPPNAPFGNNTCGGLGAGSCYGGVTNAHLAYSNTLVGGDPATPVLTAKAGQEVRMHLTVPHGSSRGTTVSVGGHVWQRDPYVCPSNSRNGLTGACFMNSVGSQALGFNPQGFAQGAQESITPMAHFTYLLPSAGGGNGVTGDYLFRDNGSFGNASGLWGILRVSPAAP